MKLTPEQQKRWAETMPVLSKITRTHSEGDGELVRSTEFGDLYLRDEHYTLVTPCSHPNLKRSTSGLVEDCPDCDYYWEYD